MKRRHITLLLAIALCRLTMLGQEAPNATVQGSDGNQLTPPRLDLHQNEYKNPFQLDMPQSEVFDNPEYTSPLPNFTILNFNNYATSSKTAFVFDRNPYAFDRNGTVSLKTWDSGALIATGSRSTLPGLFTKDEAGFVVMQRLTDKLTFTGSLNAQKTYLWHQVNNNFSISGRLTYQVDERLSLYMYGDFYRYNQFYSPAMLPYMGYSSFGLAADMQFGDHFGMEMGASRDYDPYRRQWLTTPIVTPYIKLNNNAKIGINVGRLVGELIDNWVNDGQYYRSGSATIGPPIPPPPPVR